MIDVYLICGAAGFLFLRGFYHSGILTGWIAEGLTQPKPIVCPVPPPAPKAAVPDEDRWMSLYLASPLAFWLDPNLWGDNPRWRDDIPISIRKPQPLPGTSIVKGCPNCGATDQVQVTAEHGDEASAWWCSRCEIDFTRAGIKKSKLRRDTEKLTRQLQDWEASRDSILPEQLLQPPYLAGTPLVMPYDPKLVFRIVQEVTWIDEYGNEQTGSPAQRRAYLDREWGKDSPDNAGQYPPGLKWGRDGACPSCGFPVAKRDGLYYCTNRDGGCRCTKKGWK